MGKDASITWIIGTSFLSMLIIGIAGIDILPQLSFAETQFETLGLCPLDCPTDEYSSMLLAVYETQTDFETLGLCPLDCPTDEYSSIFLSEFLNRGGIF